MRIVNHPPTENKRQRHRKPGDAYIADAFRRATCARCEKPVIAFGEAIRVDRVEGGFEIIHMCAECATCGVFLALKASAEPAEHEQQRERFQPRRQPRPADRREAA